MRKKHDKKGENFLILTKEFQVVFFLQISFTQIVVFGFLGEILYLHFVDIIRYIICGLIMICYVLKTKM
jgi:hypothetical protein